MKSVAAKPGPTGAEKHRLLPPPGRIARGSGTAVIPVAPAATQPPGASARRLRFPAAFLAQLARQGAGRAEVAAERRERNERAAAAYSAPRRRHAPCGATRNELA